jgi:hypothetical protein
MNFEDLTKEQQISMIDEEIPSPDTAGSYSKLWMIVEQDDIYIITNQKREMKRLLNVLYNNYKISLINVEIGRQNHTEYGNRMIHPEHESLINFLGTYKPIDDDLLSIRKNNLERLAICKHSGYFTEKLILLPEIKRIFKE